MQDVLREAVVLAACINHPALIAANESALERLEFRGAGHDLLRSLLLYHQADPDLLSILMEQAPLPTESVLLHRHVSITQALRADAPQEGAAQCLGEALGRLFADRAHRLEIADAEDDLSGVADEGVTWRLSKAAEAIQIAARGTQEAKADSVVAPNGVELNREELDRARQVHNSIDFSRGGKGGRTGR